MPDGYPWPKCHLRARLSRCHDPNPEGGPPLD
jgi:hypothetical protein